MTKNERARLEQICMNIARANISLKKMYNEPNEEQKEAFIYHINDMLWDALIDFETLLNKDNDKRNIK